MFFAHSTDSEDKSDWQTLRGHLVEVARLAAERGDKFGAGKAAGLAGLLHDLGKYTPAFQRRLSGSGERVDHSSAGAQEIMRLVTGGRDRGMAELIAYAIAGHHAGLPDREGDAGSLTERWAKLLEALDQTWREEIKLDAVGLLPAGFRPHSDVKRVPFQLSLLGRMIFSCLVDADFRDTEAFYAAIESREIYRDWPALPAVIGQLVGAYDAYMATKRAAASDSPVNHLRDTILAHVRSRAEEAPGLFSLTVPTGGGKTLASLGFALEHARRHGLERIIYAIPFTSVIDQTAATFRDVLGEDMVLEHHSAIDEERLEEREGADKLRLAMENWAAPIVVTTNVQLFESLFANRPSRCRKLHNLARSVIVLDEAQTIPLPVLRPCVAALDELALNYGTSIVLCTATQPALQAPEFFGGFKPEAVRELAPDPARLSVTLKRVEVHQAGTMSDDDLLAALAKTDQGLVIVNSRVHALALYSKLQDSGLDGVMHLTTRQYAAHRRLLLAEVRVRLRQGQPCRLIATSLVEAGVDLDFPRVWRAEAGLDQIAQAAGRCNREGRRPLEESIVTIFRPADFKAPRELDQLAKDFGRIAPRHPDLLSLDAIRNYFGEVYWRKDDALDAKAVLQQFRADASGTSFAYRSVAEVFRLIDSNLTPVIVARDAAAREALAQLASKNGHAGRVARLLQPFTVQVPSKARTLLLANGHAAFERADRFGDQFAVLRTDGLYQTDTGLLWDDADYLRVESWIV
jgi:CRISPR-associated endonuclease/helicase Cas3